MKISSQFDSGSIDVLSIDPAGQARLQLRKDVVSDTAVDIRQWFHFRLQGARGKAVDLCIENASRATFPGGWPGYRACASYDRSSWFRVPTTYVDGQLTISHTPQRDSMNVVEIASHPTAASSHCWIIARQHPGETMAEWLVEGLIDRLLDENDKVSTQLLAETTFHIVPNMNPDGSVHGNLRVNTTGANLNREWMTPSMERSPEVLCVRAAMERTGCDFFLDVHGDETIPHVFVAGCEMLPTITPQQNAAQDDYVQALLKSATDFQTARGYTANRYSSDALKLASKWAGHRFGCVSLTLELPFKDHNDRPDAVAGWSAARSMQLGRDVLAALAETRPQK